MAGGSEQRLSFIVRLGRNSSGGFVGVIERVRTGEKSRVVAVEEVGAVLAEMLAREDSGDSPS
jgi:hypothetical protein